MTVAKNSKEKQDWSPGKKVNSGFVKDATVWAVLSDGSYLLEKKLKNGKLAHYHVSKGQPAKRISGKEKSQLWWDYGTSKGTLDEPDGDNDFDEPAEVTDADLADPVAPPTAEHAPPIPTGTPVPDPVMASPAPSNPVAAPVSNISAPVAAAIHTGQDSGGEWWPGDPHGGRGVRASHNWPMLGSPESPAAFPVAPEAAFAPKTPTGTPFNPVEAGRAEPLPQAGVAWSAMPQNAADPPGAPSSQDTADSSDPFMEAVKKFAEAVDKFSELMQGKKDGDNPGIQDDGSFKPSGDRPRFNGRQSFRRSGVGVSLQILDAAMRAIQTP